jgi:ATP-dependent helicase/nuclease subunit A
VRFDESWGVALKFEDGQGGTVAPFAYRAIELEQKQREKAEEDRIAYVAFTRARDRLVLTSLKESGGALDSLLPGLEAAAMTPQLVDVQPNDMQPPLLPSPDPSPWSGGELLGRVGSGLSEIPVTGLDVYAACPQRFKLQVVDRHPGLLDGVGTAARIGTLTHLSIEKGITEPDRLAAQDPALPTESVLEALQLAETFRSSPVYAEIRTKLTSLEAPIWFRRGGLALSGRVDGVGADFVVDFKTDREVDPDRHALQLWAYAKALNQGEAYIAYLRHERLERFSTDQLETAGARAEAIIAGIRKGAFEGASSPERCGACTYASICVYSPDAGGNG